MPRKALLVLAAVVGAIAIPAGAAATVYSLLDYQSAVDSLLAIDSTIDPPPNDPSRDFAVGGFQGTNELGDTANVGFSAHGGPLGEDPQGHLSETVPLFFPTNSRTYQARFRVTCVSITGNDAALGLVPETDNAANDQPAQFLLLVHDSGLPGGTEDREAFGPDALATDCLGQEVFAPSGFEIDRGNILVNDALLP